MLFSMLKVPIFIFAPLVFLWLSISVTFLYYAEITWDQIFHKLLSLDNVETELFDFIIVGAGASGSVLLNRLSSKYKVLLLEAGGTNRLLDIPYLGRAFVGQDHIDWKFRTVPQKNSGFSLNDNTVLLPSGKVLGGSTAFTENLFFWGNVTGFDSIAEKTGDPIWRADNIIKSYERIYREQEKYIKGPKKEISKVVNTFRDASLEMGFNEKDPLSPSPAKEGFSAFESNQKYGLRWNAFQKFVLSIWYDNDGYDEGRIMIRKYAQVNKILFDDSKRAYGVEFDHHGVKKIAKCSKEVIVSGGAIGTAKLLLLSGIGPKKDLDEIGISTIADLPVGKNFMDKYGTSLGPISVSENQTFVKERDLNFGVVLEFFLHQTGPISSYAIEGALSIRTESQKRKNLHHPNMDIYLITLNVNNVPSINQNRLNFKHPEVTENYFDKVDGDAFIFFLGLYPKGVGEIKLKDSNPNSELHIDPKYLEHPEDLENLVEGVKFTVKLIEGSESFKKINASFLPYAIPGCEHVKFRSDDYWKCIAGSLTVSMFKYSSTAPIGKESDPIAVVDSRLRPFGTTGLRIVDSSVLRESDVSINEVTCSSLADFASEFIIEHWEKLERNFIVENGLNPIFENIPFDEKINSELKIGKCENRKLDILENIALKK